MYELSKNTNWVWGQQNQHTDSTPSEDSDQTGHLLSLIGLRCTHEEKDQGW